MQFLTFSYSSVTFFLPLSAKLAFTLKILRHLIPYFFEKEPMAVVTDSELKERIKEVKQQPNALQAMQYALDVMAQRYDSKAFDSVFHISKLFDRGVNKLWKRTGFMHCTQQNYLLRTLLVKGNKISDENIRLGYSLVWGISPHQFLIVRYKGQEIALDPWNYGRGAKLGRFASGFGWTHL